MAKKENVECRMELDLLEIKQHWFRRFHWSRMKKSGRDNLQSILIQFALVAIDISNNNKLQQRHKFIAHLLFCQNCQTSKSHLPEPITYVTVSYDFKFGFFRLAHRI
ncbi:unnamed protein product [Albugo candida]|uniref:Uncharacterized protein n=1 Tax=Albugo candida TaxID=65357 RepID=A0A024GM75_9STRA|nr:unnamed protein product [Albugo candida]|eukprot:CCI47642.1 unnamed protein product [Albugo candida]